MILQNGFKAAIKKLENCAGGDAVMQVEDGFKLDLTPDCKLVVSGCANVKAFNTGTAKYKIMKNGMTLKQGTEDMCSVAKTMPDNMKAMAKSMGVPEGCPVKADRLCAENVSIDVSKYKSMIGFAKGSTEAEISITHDTGKTCYKVAIEITK